jgi:hypothetical protein
LIQQIDKPAYDLVRHVPEKIDHPARAQGLHAGNQGLYALKQMQLDPLIE